MQVKASQKKSNLGPLHVSAGLVAILVAVTVANTRQGQIAGESTSLSSSSGRKIASVGDQNIQPSAALTDRLVKELKYAQSEQKSAVRPSAMDRLLFEKLDGRYSVTTVQGKLLTLELSEAKQGIEVANEIEFVRDFAALLDMTDVSTLESRQEGDQTHTLLAGSSMSAMDQKSFFEMVLDSTGRLLSLKKVSESSLQ